MKKFTILASLLAAVACTGHKSAMDLATADAARFAEADTVKFWFPVHDQTNEELLPLFEEHTIEADPSVGPMKYYTYDPTAHGYSKDRKYPLIVVFHGAGNGMEGVKCVQYTDMAIYAGKTYQTMLGGAYLLFPKANETPEDKVTWLTRGEDGHSVYSASAHAIIEEFLSANESCDASKVVVGGTSAGGFMTWDYLSQYHDSVAGAFLASPAGNPSKEDLEAYNRQGLPIWAAHCVRDCDTPFSLFTGPVAGKLLKMKSVRLTVLDRVRFADKRVVTLPIPESDPSLVKPLPGLEAVPGAGKAHDMGPHLTLHAFGANMLYTDGTPYDSRYPEGFIGWLVNDVFAYPRLTPETIDEVLAAMTLKEKVTLLVGDAWGTRTMDMGLGLPDFEDPYESGPVKAPGAPFSTRPLRRFGIPGTGMADGSAGVRIDATRPGTDKTFYATCFPSNTAMAASWNRELVSGFGTMAGEEIKEYGLDVILGPGMDLQRDLLCGRNFEYYSEDPFLTGKMASAWVSGVQSNGVGVSAKHFAANDVELNRLNSDSRMNPRTLREMSLKGFEILVREAQPWTLMSSYNKINGVFTQQSHDLLQDILRDEWGFGGIVITDWGYKPGTVEAVKAGNDVMEAGLFFEADRIMAAVEDGSLPMEDVDRNVRRVLEYIVKTPSFKGYVPSNEPDLAAHASAVREGAAESFVLLKNEGSTLPLENLGRVALFGCTSYDMVAGGTGSANVNMKHLSQLSEGFDANGIEVDESLASWYRAYVAEGREKSREADSKLILGKLVIPDPMPDPGLISSSVDNTDAAIITIGRNAGEGNDRRAAPGDWNLTETELELIRSVTQACHAVGKKAVVVLNTGGAIETASWKDIPDAILMCWSPGQEAGLSIADVITGRSYPSGKLPMTLPVNYLDVSTSANFPYDILPKPPKYLGLGNVADMGPGIKNVGYINYQEGIWVGYRYFNTACKEVSYPFGYGLGYTTFEYSDLKVKAGRDGSLKVSLKVKNIGSRAGKEAVQVYVKAPSGGLVKPEAELRDFGKTRELKPGESQKLEFRIDPYTLASYNESSAAWETAPGEYVIKVGASVEDIRLSGTVKLDRSFSWPTHRAMLPEVPVDEIQVVGPVKVDGGLVQGIMEDDVVIYKGIPFAAPPVGELRGKELQGVQPWEGVLRADSFRAAAMQSAKDPNDPIYYREFFADGEPEYSDDCMYLNIWAPSASVGHPDSGIPVAVWIHGGGFAQGYCFEKEMDGTEWAKRGVILVTIPYRLGSIGFSEEVGLLGLKDQITALKWVRDNIAAFGGDPSNVTIFGQSAGAMSCKYLPAFPEAEPLFARSILQSGGGTNDMSWHPTLPYGTGGKDVPEYVEKGLYDSKPIMMGWVAQDPPFLGEPTVSEFANLLLARPSERPVYIYAFNRNLPGEAKGEPDFGAFHSFELWYIFGTLSRCWRPFTKADYALSARMLDAWTSFAKTGNPGWEAAVPGDLHTKIFDVE